ncbi:hypothetical protein GCM10009789_08680 [Kribbella sancticallisti]|uniref:Uncharacterized protein n=1 Tax=Kribbella sancticallisti TaxID=460087 RepID=A0ABN2CH32_9ACTN
MGRGLGEVGVPIGEVPGDHLIARGCQEVPGGAERSTDFQAIRRTPYYVNWLLSAVT